MDSPAPTSEPRGGRAAGNGRALLSRGAWKEAYFNKIVESNYKIWCFVLFKYNLHFILFLVINLNQIQSTASRELATWFQIWKTECLQFCTLLPWYWGEFRSFLMGPAELQLSLLALWWGRGVRKTF